MTPKELEKLVKVCRKMGIRTYKQGDVEFTLGDVEFMPRETKQVKGEKKTLKADELVNDHMDLESFEELSIEDKLFWSAAHGVPVPEENQK